VIAPPPPVVEAPPAPAPPPKPAIRKGITPIKREELEYPKSAIRLGIDKGRVVARLNIDEKGQRHERDDRVRGTAPPFRQVGDRGPHAMEIRRRRREIRWRNRGQLYVEVAR
jgi:hypothetical protein